MPVRNPDAEGIRNGPQGQEVRTAREGGRGDDMQLVRKRIHRALSGSVGVPGGKEMVLHMEVPAGRRKERGR